jgi:hypothetical protein
MNKNIKPADRFCTKEDFQSQTVRVKIGSITAINHADCGDEEREIRRKLHLERGGAYTDCYYPHSEVSILYFLVATQLLRYTDNTQGNCPSSITSRSYISTIRKIYPRSRHD